MTHIVDRAVSSKLVAVARGANRPDERGRGETGDGEANSPTQKTAKEQNLQKARITKQRALSVRPGQGVGLIGAWSRCALDVYP